MSSVVVTCVVGSVRLRVGAQHQQILEGHWRAIPIALAHLAEGPAPEQALRAGCDVHFVQGDSKLSVVRHLESHVARGFTAFFMRICLDHSERDLRTERQPVAARYSF